MYPKFYYIFLFICPKQIVQPCLFQCTRNTAYGSGDVSLSSLSTIFIVKDGDDGENHDNGDVQIISRMLMMVVVIMVTIIKQQ